MALELGGHSGVVAFIYLPSLVGSAAFVFASYVYLLEVADDPANPFWKGAPLGATPREKLGLWVAKCNLLGSVLFLLASVAYFASLLPDGDADVNEYADALVGVKFCAEMWGVRFGFAVGSWFFVLGAFLSFPEILSDI